VKSVEPKEAPSGKSAKKVFHPKLFFANMGAGKAIFKFRKNQHVFEQGDVTDTVFYIQTARSSSLSYLTKARKLSSLPRIPDGRYCPRALRPKWEVVASSSKSRRTQ
jgi:hypothetical protein